MIGRDCEALLAIDRIHTGAPVGATGPNPSCGARETVYCTALIYLRFEHGVARSCGQALQPEMGRKHRR